MNPMEKDTKIAMQEAPEAEAPQEITAQELGAAKEALLSSLRGIHDSPASIESYYSTHYLSGAFRSPQRYMAEIEAVTVEDVVAAANTVRLHTTYFLKGVLS